MIIVSKVYKDVLVIQAENDTDIFILRPIITMTYDSLALILRIINFIGCSLLLSYLFRK